MENRIQKHKDLITKVIGLNNEIMDIQEEKFKILTDFLEYEEALTTDKESANRIKSLLKSIGVWQNS